MTTSHLDGKAPDAHKFMPREHPLRQEAIMLVGRNAEETRQTQIVQTVKRDKKNEPVWGSYIVETYNEPMTENNKVGGLIDALFD